jgi:hypothetical protein
MSYIIKGILNQQLPWGLVLLGVMIAIVLEMSGIPSLAFAVGVYLPLSSSSPIFIGGMIRWLVDKYLRGKFSGKNLTEEEFSGLRRAMAGVTSAGGTAASANIKGLVIAGKTGSAQNTSDPNKDHAWFVGFAPAEDPKIVVAVFLEFGIHGYFAARVASKIIGKYLGYGGEVIANTEGG